MLDTSQPATLDDVLAALDAVVANQAELRARIEQLERTHASNDDLLTVAAAARIVGRSEQCIRDWCDREGVGRFDEGIHRYWVSRAKLRSYVLTRFGIVPANL